MLDSALKPWLIEVNHLPSFGTDSPLDRDIKERLMEQVFSVLPVMADDQQAYLLHHKAESEKRLVAQRSVARAAEEKERATRAALPPKKKETTLPPVKEPNGGDHAAEAPVSLFTTPAPTAELSAEDTDGAASGAARESSSSDDDDDDEAEDGECTPERLAQIKLILQDVYQRFSPEKMGKIDRLLSKYAAHEEEFLRFVFQKYSVDPKMYRRFGRPAAAAAGGSEQSKTDDGDHQQPGGAGGAAGRGKERQGSLTPKATRPNGNREVSVIQIIFVSI